MKTSHWGEHAWHFLHAVAYEYPETPSLADRRAATRLFRSLMKMLPCQECCQHYAQEMRRDPIEEHLGSRDELCRWVLDLHNKVSRRLGKPEWTMSQLHDKYKGASCDVRSSCGTGDHGFMSGGAAAPAEDGSSTKSASVAIASGVIVSAFLVFGVLACKK